MFFNGRISKQSISNKLAIDPSNVGSGLTSTFNNIATDFTNKNQPNLYVSSIRRGQRNKSSAKHTSSQPMNFSKNTKTLVQPKQSMVQEQISVIQNYLGSHNKFKTYFKSKKYKKIYNQLSKQVPLQKSYFPLYMQDRLFSLNKHVKVSLVHKQTSFSEYLGPYFQAGKQLICDFYKRFLIDDQLYKGSKRVDPELVSTHQKGRSSSVSQFFYIVITFLHQLSIFYRSKNQRKQAQLYYESNLRIIDAILQSSTSNCRLRRKISQSLISFSSFLIEKQQLIKAQRILNMALKNSINLVAIIEARLFYGGNKKNRANTTGNSLQKYQKRANRTLKQAFQLMIAIYLNSAVIYQLQHKQHLSYVALNQVRYLQQIIYKRYSIRTRILQVIKKPKQAYDYQSEKIHIVKCYFNFEQIIKSAKQESQLKINANVGIYGIKSLQKAINNKQKSIQQLFFKVKVRQTANRINQANQFKQKIVLIQYDNETNIQDKKLTNDQYIINRKKKDISRSSTICLQTKSFSQKRKLSLKEGDEGQSNSKKLSKFYRQDTTDNDNTKQQNKSQYNNDSHLNLQKPKIQKKSTYFKTNGQKKVDQSINKPQESEFLNDPNFLDKLIQSQLNSQKHFLYGKQFVQNYKLISKGRTYHNRRSPKKQKSKTTYSQPFNKKNDMIYTTKNEIQAIFGKENNKQANQTNKNTNKKTLAKKKRTVAQNFQSKPQNRLLSAHIVKHETDDFYEQNKMQLQDQKMAVIFKKRSITSLKNGPMNYKDIMQRIQITQNYFLKKDYIQKNSIYRLKCRSQNSSKKKYGHNNYSLDSFSKSSNMGLQHDNQRKQSQRELIKLKAQRSQPMSQFMFLDQEKKSNLTKKGPAMNMYSNNQTGIRLLKKIIFKHKKRLKIKKSDLFVNYTKSQQDIKLVQRQSLLAIQYNMCEQETKARIKQNMRQLIVDNVRNSEQNQKRAQKITKAINEYNKNKRLNQFSAKMKQSYEGQGRAMTDFQLVSNLNCFSGTFRPNQQEQGQTNDKNSIFADPLMKRIFENRVHPDSNQFQFLGLGGQNLLTDNKINSPSLFLSSIKYKQEQKSGKKPKTFKSIYTLTSKGLHDRNQSQDGNFLINKGLQKKSATFQLEQDQYYIQKSFTTLPTNQRQKGNLMSDNWD